ncbi:dihydrolipoyl dehydrogenase family protein [Tateyamaria pelophila]|uniref:dihydrolipoyl dehydrogenase family protein n=1 Tax=Tateyamaria pelophila TaxID=328415 RepID=UPI001CBAE1E0|nr:FAD-dependent oxidoreductase [Tateyamaria pelophila]
MAESKFETIVIGGGSAGLAFATTAGRIGGRVLLVERAQLGGTCVNRGCVPKKILWAAGNLANSVKDAAAQKIMQANPVDFETLVKERDSHIAGIRASYVDTLKDAGVRTESGQAVIVDAKTVEVGQKTFKADQIVLATGGRPAVLEIEGSEFLQDSDDVLSWARRPDRIVIVGGGYIGCEFAAIFAALGSTVSLIHDGPHILDAYPKDLALHVQERLRNTGIDLYLNYGVRTVRKEADRTCCTLQSGETKMADAIVAATGRVPNIDDLGVLVAQLDTADSGALKVTKEFETSCPGIYAIGDVADRLPLTPVASADGTVLAHKLHGNGASAIDLDLVATTTFVYPPAAHVGTVGHAPAREGCVTPLEKNVMASNPAASDFYQICADESSNALIGAAIAARGAEDIIAMAGALIAAKAKVDAFTAATPVHPSFAEEFFSDTRKDD